MIETRTLLLGWHKGGGQLNVAGYPCIREGGEGGYVIGSADQASPEKVGLRSKIWLERTDLRLSNGGGTGRGESEVER